MTKSTDPCIAYINSHHRVEEYLGVEFEEARQECAEDGNFSWATIVIMAIEKRMEAARVGSD